MSLAVKNTALWALKVHVGLGVVKLLVHGIIVVWSFGRQTSYHTIIGRLEIFVLARSVRIAYILFV